jgi:hypothetical protein
MSAGGPSTTGFEAQRVLLDRSGELRRGVLAAPIGVRNSRLTSCDADSVARSDPGAAPRGEFSSILSYKCVIMASGSIGPARRFAAGPASARRRADMVRPIVASPCNSWPAAAAAGRSGAMALANAGGR